MSKMKFIIFMAAIMLSSAEKREEKRAGNVDQFYFRWYKLYSIGPILCNFFVLYGVDKV